MKRIKIKDIEVSKIALGTWAIGGGRDWGPTPETDALNTISAALEAGINFIDTAPIYGNFRAEELLGKALKGQRQKAVIATKCGLLAEPRAVRRDLSPASLQTEIEASLKRLGTDYIDFYLIHWPDKNTPLQDTLAQMQKFKEQGKIRQIGVCNFTADLLEEAVKYADIAVVQNEYSYLRQEQGDSVFDTCKKYNIAFLAYGPMAGGVLSGKYKKEPNLPNCDARTFFYQCSRGADFEAAQNAVEKLAAVAAGYKAKPAQAAINWVLANSAVACAIAGARTLAQLKDIAAADAWRLTPQDMAFLNNETV